MAEALFGPSGKRKSRRQELADQLLAQNLAYEPITGWGHLAAKLAGVAGGIWGAWSAERADREERAGLMKELASASNPDVMTAGPGASSARPSSEAIANKLMASDNPQAQELGSQMLLSAMTREPAKDEFQLKEIEGPGGKPAFGRFSSASGRIEPIEGVSPPKKQDPESRGLTHMGGGYFWNKATNQVEYHPDVAAARIAERQAGRPSTNVNVGAPDITFPRPDTEKEADKAFGKGLGEMAGDLVKGGPKRQTEISKYNQMEGMLGKLEESGRSPGKFQQFRTELARSWYGLTGQQVPEDIQDFKAFSGMVNQDLLRFIGAAQGGIPASGFSDRDMEIVRSMAANADDDPNTLRAKMATARAMARNEQQFADDVMKFRKTMGTEEAMNGAVEAAKKRDPFSSEPILKQMRSGAAAIDMNEFNLLMEKYGQ